MNVPELLAACRRDRTHFQLHVNDFVDEFRRATAVTRAAMVAVAPMTTGPFEGLAAAVVSALCRETGLDAPAWVAHTASPEPFFVLPAFGMPILSKTGLVVWKIPAVGEVMAKQLR